MLVLEDTGLTAMGIHDTLDLAQPLRKLLTCLAAPISNSSLLSFFGPELVLFLEYIVLPLSLSSVRLKSNVVHHPSHTAHLDCSGTSQKQLVCRPPGQSHPRLSVITKLL